MRGETIIAGGHLDAGSISWEVVFLPADKMSLLPLCEKCQSSSETAHVKPVDRQSQIEIPLICGNPEKKHMVRSCFAALHPLLALSSSPEVAWRQMVGHNTFLF